MLFYSPSKESFNHDQCDPLDAQLMKGTRAEIKTAIDILEISDDFFKYIIDEKIRKLCLPQQTARAAAHPQEYPGQQVDHPHQQELLQLAPGPVPHFLSQARNSSSQTETWTV